jgi:hypothetical protein
MLNFLRKKHAKIQKHSRSVGKDTPVAAAMAWKFLKFSPSRRRRLSRSAYTSIYGAEFLEKFLD